LYLNERTYPSSIMRSVTTRYQPQDSNSLKMTPMTAPDLDCYPATTLTTLGHHRPSLPPATATPSILLVITAVTATSALIPAITPSITTTSAPAPATPDTPLAHAETPIMHHNHTSPLTQPPHAMPTPAPLLTT
ncbi:hypothetical protein C0993_009773, partial [Termitomyces sp. T159_Od127]